MSALLLPPTTPADPAGTAAVQSRLAPFVSAEVLTPLEPVVVELLGRKVGERDPEVLLALALAVRAPRQGHVCVVLDGPLPAAESPLDWPADRAAWRAAVAASPLVGAPGDPAPHPFLLAGQRLYSARCWSDENGLADDILRLLRTAPELDAALLEQGLRALFAAPAGVALAAVDDRQLHAAAQAVGAGFAVITGGPGTGKTWTVRNVLTLLFAQHQAATPGAPLRVALAAPTGKAAARMKESLAKGLDAFLAERAGGALPPGVAPAALGAFLSGLSARTVHRLLRVDPSRPGRFQHDRDRPLPVDAVVVDESSMLDLGLMARLVEAVGPETRLILLGDEHQLASVEAGSVLADLCAAQGPVRAHVAQLTESRRFHAKSGIGAVARATLAGDPAAALGLLQSPDWPDVAWIGLDAAGRPGPALARTIVAGYRPCLDRLLAGPRPGESADAHALAVLRAFDDFRLLAAHRAGPLGVSGLVALTEALLARAVPGFRPRAGAYLGRPVLITRNDYAVGLYNGDIGIVLRREGRLVVAFETGGQLRLLSPSRLPPHETVFAMTIHKSQGSEFTHTAVVLPRQPSPIVTRELVYTGITRARTQLTVVGRPAVFSAGVEAQVHRATGLAAALGAPAP